MGVGAVVRGHGRGHEAGILHDVLPGDGRTLDEKNADLVIDPERAVILAAAAVRRAEAVDESTRAAAVESLHRALTTSRLAGRIAGFGGPVDWSPAGDLVASGAAGDSGTVELRMASGTVVRRIDAHDADLTGLAFSIAGDLLATTGADGVARIWDVGTGEMRHAVMGGGGPAASPSCSRRQTCPSVGRTSTWPSRSPCSLPRPRTSRSTPWSTRR